MSSVDGVTFFKPEIRNRTVRRPFYADWAVFFAVLVLLGAIVMVEISTGSTSFVAGTLDRLNAYDSAPGVPLPVGEAGPDDLG